MTQMPCCKKLEKQEADEEATRLAKVKMLHWGYLGIVSCFEFMGTSSAKAVLQYVVNQVGSRAFILEAQGCVSCPLAGP